MEKENSIEARIANAKERIEILTGYITVLKSKEEGLAHQKSMLAYTLSNFIRPEIKNAEDEIEGWKAIYRGKI